MAEVVQVDTFGGHITGDKDADRRFIPSKFFHDLLLIDIAHATMQGLDSIGGHTEVLLEVFCQPAHGFDALSKDDQPVICNTVIPTIGWITQQLQQFLVSGKVLRLDFFQRMLQHGKSTALFHRVFKAFLFKAAHAALNRFQTRGRAGEHCLLEGHIAEPAVFCLGQHGFIGDERLKRRFFLCGGSTGHLTDMALFKTVLCLILNIFLEATDKQAFDVVPVILDVLLSVVIRIRNGSRIKHVHQRSEGTGAAVVRGGGQHNQCIAPAGKQICQAGTLGTAVASLGHIMCLIDDYNIPPGVFKMDTVFAVPLDRINGNDGLVIVVERVMVAGQIPANTLDLR